MTVVKSQMKQFQPSGFYFHCQQKFDSSRFQGKSKLSVLEAPDSSGAVGEGKGAGKQALLFLAPVWAREPQVYILT